MTCIHFIVPGTPVGWQRVDSNRGRRYDTPRNKAAKTEIAMLARAAMGSTPMLTGPVRLTIRAVFAPFPSWSKRKRDATLGTFHTSKPDRDNIEKLISDALTGVVWKDDSQVADGPVTKLWGPTAQTAITVEAL